MPYFHDLSPILIPISGDFAVRWYGISYVAGFVIAYFVLLTLAKRGRIQIPPRYVADAMMMIVLGTLIGGRLGYALVYDQKLLYTFTGSFPWWNLLAINKGGMASHGGMVGIMLGCWRVSRGWKTETGEVVGRTTMLHVMDVMGLVAGFGLLLGRFANFINGELLGKIVSPPGTPGPWWSVQFPQELLGWKAPGVREKATHAPDLSIEQQIQLHDLVRSVQKPGEAWDAALGRIIAHAGDYKQQLIPLLSSRHASQLYQAAAEGLVLGLIVWAIWWKPRKPGVVAAWWFMIYGVLRILTETIRLPDAQFGDAGRIIGLSRGQWLSVAMVVFGAGLLVYALRRAGPAIGGWGKRSGGLVNTQGPRMS